MKAKIVLFILKTFALLPLKVNHLLAIVMGNLSYYLNSKEKKVALKNIQHCFAAKSSNWQNKLTRLSLIESAKAKTELGSIWTGDITKLNSWVVEETGKEVFENALNKKNGTIIISPHFGSWELAALHYCQQQPVTYLYTQPKLKELDSVIINARLRYGGILAPANARGVMQLIKTLKKGEVIGIAADQIPKNGNGLLSNFYQQPCYTMTLLSKLATKTNATVVFSALERLPNAKGFKMHYLQAPKSIYSNNLQESVDALNNMFEQLNSINLAQYLWSYKRFKKMETSQKDIYS